MKKKDIKKELLKFKKKGAVKKVEDIEELGLDIYMRQFDALERMRLADKMQEFYGIDMRDLKDGKEDDIKITNEGYLKYMMYCLFMSIVDEDGVALFDTFEETVEIVTGFPSKTIAKISGQIQKYNALEGGESVKKPSEPSEMIES